METLDTHFYVKKLTRFVCEKCDFKCYMKCDWDRHLLTRKHSVSHKVDTLETKKLKKTYFCDCGKNFLSRSGFYKHNKVCNFIKEENEISENNEIEIKKNDEIIKTDKDLIFALINDNKELRNMLVEQCKEKEEYKMIMMKVLENGTHNNSTNHSHNKTFNLNMFLNETCKDAMNISDFMNSIQLQMSDLEDVGELGYVNGISNIIIKNLKALDVTKRPIHCTDAKREILYVKDEDKWEKETDQKDKMVHFVKNIANKNIRMLNEYKKRYPDCVKYESKHADQYNKLVIEAMGGSNNNDEENHQKIIKKISKEVTIEK